MHIYEYMRDRASLLLTICAIVCLIVVMLYLLSISWLLIDVLLIGIILCVLIGTTIDYVLYLRTLRAFNTLAVVCIRLQHTYQLRSNLAVILYHAYIRHNAYLTCVAEQRSY
jgi:uncharacterized membrane protein